MKILVLLVLLTLSPLAAQADTVYFLGPDRGVYMDAGNGIKRVGLAVGNSLSVQGDTLYLAGDDGQVWSADKRGRWKPIVGTSQARKIVFGANATMFVLGADGGVYRLGKDTKRHGLATVTDLAAAANGDLYAIGTDGKVWVSRAQLGGKDSWVPFNGLAQGKKIAVAPDGTVYIIGNDSGVYKIGSKSIDRLGLATGQEISVSPQGQVGIVGTDGGVYLLSGSSRWSRLGSGTARQVVWPR